MSDATLTLAVEGSTAPIVLTQPVTSGTNARRRLVIEPGTTPTAGDSVELTIPAVALVDTSGNSPTVDYSLSFSWPSGDAVVDDSAAPRLSDITVREGVMEIELSEEAGLSSAAAAIQIDGAPTSWTLDESRYVLVSEAMLSTGTHQIDVGTGALNLVGAERGGR
ncbi:MAG: hypothetical protein WBO54_01830 [Thermoanaerobaculia bacterium]